MDAGVKACKQACLKAFCSELERDKLCSSIMHRAPTAWTYEDCASCSVERQPYYCLYKSVRKRTMNESWQQISNDSRRALNKRDRWSSRERWTALRPDRSLLCSIRVLFVCSLLLSGDMGALLADGKKCYSCMSMFYGSAWDLLKFNEIYNEPGLERNNMHGGHVKVRTTDGDDYTFTDHCNNPAEHTDLLLQVNCPENDNCVTLKEKIPVGFGSYGFVRGCYDGIFKWGFNAQGLAGRLQFREFCHNFNMTTLMQDRSKSLHNTEVLACSCRGHLCNGAQQAANNAAGSLWLYFLATLAPLVVSYSANL